MFIVNKPMTADGTNLLVGEIPKGVENWVNRDKLVKARFMSHYDGPVFECKCGRRYSREVLVELCPCKIPTESPGQPEDDQIGNNQPPNPPSKDALLVIIKKFTGEGLKPGEISKKLEKIGQKISAQNIGKMLKAAA